MNGELIKVYRRDGFTLRLYDLGYDFQQYKNRLGYQLKDHNQLIFEGDDYFPSPMFAIDSLQCVYTLLHFLSLQEGDVDSEFFEAYTLDQLAWRDSVRGEELNWIALTGLQRHGYD